MKFIWAIFKRELRSFFVSPLAYTAIATFLALMGVLFLLSLNAYENLRIQSATRLRPVPAAEALVKDLLGSNVIWSLVLIVPLLTMRLLAEERRQHTAEMLLTAPMTTRQLILGKFLGSLFMLVMMLGLCFWMPLLMRMWGDADPGPIITGYLGAFLYGGFLLAVGLLASSLTESPFQSAILAFVFLALLNMSGYAAAAIPYIGQGLEQFSPLTNLKALAQGTIQTQAVIYFVSLTVFMLDLTARVVDSQRWR